MNRMPFAVGACGQTVALALAVVLCLAGGPMSRADEPRARPNVLFIAADDLNDWVGFLGGHPQVKTPHLDRLAKRGVVFANAHCAAPLCSPSRAAVFGGKQPFHTGIYGNDDNILKLQPQPVLLPEYFKARGYRTYGTGKLLHQNDHRRYDESFAAEQRWSPFTSRQVEYTPEELPSKATDRPRHVIEQAPGGKRVVLPLNGLLSDRAPRSPAGESFDWGPVDVPDGEMGDAKIADWAAERLRRRHEQPFFLAVGFYRPHIPLFAPRRYFDLYPAEAVELPPTRKDDLDDLSETARRLALQPVTAGAHATVVKHNQWKQAVAAYLACVSFVDAQVGRLLDALDRSPHADNTVIVFWGDHGWHLGEKQHWGKWTGWERATRVPLVIVPPKGGREHFKVGGVCRQPVGLIDLYPTLLDLCALPAEPDLDGVSLVPQLRDPAATTRPVLTTFGKGNHTVRDDRWRLIRYADGSEELYDHDQDPHEWKNLAADRQFASVRDRLEKSLPAAAQSPKLEALVKELNRLCDEQPFQTGWHLKVLATGETAQRRGHDVVPSASTRKIAILMAALKAVNEKKLSLEQPVKIQAKYQDNTSGVFQHLRPDGTITFRDALVLMIIVSDNTCTGTVADMVGLDSINALCRSIGMKGTTHRHGIPPKDLAVDHPVDATNATTPADVGLLLDLILQGGKEPKAAAKLGCTVEQCRLALDILSWQKYRQRLPALLPLGTKVAHKTGTGRRNYNDAGIIFQGDQPLFILTVYTDKVPVELPDGMPGHAVATQLISRLSRTCWDALKTPGPKP